MQRKTLTLSLSHSLTLSLSQAAGRSIPVTNTSVNPARSTGVAVYVGGWAVAQLWAFWIAPIVGAVLGATIYRWIGEPET